MLGIQNNNNRSLMQYRHYHEVRLPNGLMSFSGFKFKGQYLKVPTKSLLQNESIIVNTISSLEFGMSEHKENWYAVFACTNESDITITYKCVPFLRIHSPYNDSVFYLMAGGEGIHTIGETTVYDWDNNALIGNDVLICSETIDNRKNAFSGRVTKITAAGTNSIGFELPGSIASFDYVLPAPSYDHYRYCGSYYIDTGEVRNFADSGNTVVSRGISQSILPESGSNNQGMELSVAGYISPLATGVILNSYYVINNTKTGHRGERFSIDSLHDVVSFYGYKSFGETSFLSTQIFIPFSFRQTYYWKSLGELMDDRSNGQHNIYGWIEP